MDELYPREYERVTSNLQRMKVPGGWLVKTHVISIGVADSIAMAFIPDPNYDWKFKEEEVI